MRACVRACVVEEEGRVVINVVVLMVAIGGVEGAGRGRGAGGGGGGGGSHWSLPSAVWRREDRFWSGLLREEQQMSGP